MQLGGSYEAILAQARGLYQDGDLEGAVAQYRRLIDRLARLSDRVLDRRPDLRELWMTAIMELGQLLEWEGRFAEAIELKRQLVDLEPDRAPMWRRHLAALRIRKGEVDAGLVDLRALAEARPDDVVAWNTLATHLRLAGRLEQADQVLDRALKAPDPDPELLGAVHLNRALLYLAWGRLDEAVAAWERAIQDSAALSDTAPEIYTALIKAGRLDEALAIVERDPDALRRGLYRGVVHARRGELDRARAAWTEVEEMEPDAEGSAEAWLEATLRLGHVDLGLERFEQLLAGGPSARLFLLGGVGWAMKGDLEAARAGFGVALDAMRRGYPPAYKFSSDDWRLLDQLVDDAEVKAQLRPHFAVVDSAFDAVVEVARSSPQAPQAKTPGGILLPGQQRDVD
jgi:tetratricopeptide (TPR) repeat protein